MVLAPDASGDVAMPLGPGRLHAKSSSMTAAIADIFTTV